jgi:hypothetical protein
VVRKQQDMTLSVTLEERRGMRESHPAGARPVYC